MQTNRVKKILKEGGLALGTYTGGIADPQIVEIIGHAGFDAAFIDMEHTSFDLRDVQLMVMAAEASEITPLVRPESNASDAIQRVLDRGAQGVQVPHVNSAAEAQRVVEAARFHPLGKRGLAAATRPAHYGFGLSLDRYVEEANRETLVCIQLEEVEALRHLDEMVQVEGVDVFFLGPSDLSQSMGLPGRREAPEVQSAMDAAFAAIMAAGRVPGSAGGAQAIARYLEQGCLYVYTHFPGLLAGGSAEFRRALGR